MMRSRRWLGLGMLPVALVGLMIVMYSAEPGLVVASVPVGPSPSQVAVDVRTGHAFVTNNLDNTVSMFDTHSGRVLRAIRVGSAPTSVVADARTGRTFVLNAGDGSVSMLDAARGVVLRTVRLHTVIDMALDERTGHVFVLGNLCAQYGTVATLDALSGTVRRTASVGWAPQSVEIDPHTGRAFVANSQSNSVSELDTASGSVLRTIAVGRSPWAVAVDTISGHAFVTNYDDGTVSVFDSRTGAVLRTVAVGVHPKSLAIDTHAQRVFIANEGDRTVSMLDARTGFVLRKILAGGVGRAVGDTPDPLAVTVDERHGHILVSQWGAPDPTGKPTSGRVSVLDSRSGQVQRLVTVGNAPVAMMLDTTTKHLLVVNSGPRGTSGLSVWGWLPSVVRRWAPGLPHPSPPSPDGSVTVLDTSRL